MRILPLGLAFWAPLFLPFFFLRMAEAGGGGAGGSANPGAGNDGKTDAGAGNGDQPPAAVDVQAEIQKALAEAGAKFAADFKAATGHDSLAAFQESEAKRKGEEGKLLEQRNAELAQARAELAQAKISAAILGAATDAVDPQTVLALLSGKAKFEGGAVTIDGKPPAEAIKALLADKPFLAKAAGAGSGTPASVGPGAEKNPWSKEHFNLTEQGRIAATDPAKAATLKAQAGAA